MIVMFPFLSVETTTDVRSRLTQIVAEFREKGLKARPVVFGSHRKPEAVLLSAELAERLLPMLLDPGFDLQGLELPRLGPPGEGERRRIKRPKRLRAS